ncbi:hypothetical protein CN425_04250 [Bacillus cereus]|uniref:Uncharacterized protein n=1 Tax=Bacillus cereus TaxID=1396 RepID=A0A2A8Q2C2_BACCE|nr:hypothetical protein [Bacillus cereus]EJS67067.1 hypothetical protein ICU_03137 [Bacillus cereus BAG2X1-1]EJS75482.1 hypothetical protein ICY_02984 [Bacillus cereus BAG2X1-3]PEA08437.1 hypothetical protein CON38_18590 [Bacillus cereus]PEW05559.1 hypothetical protein CN425_04250 [Bacillus cereus]PFI22938.1 hypothetical protein COI75_16350 [Bacillus cereus]
MVGDSLNDFLVAELEGEYVLQEKVFDAKNFTVYMATPVDNKIEYDRLILMKHLSNKVPSVHIWETGICKKATNMEIVKEVTEAIQLGFINKD